MAKGPTNSSPEVIDPVTGEPLRASRLNSLVVGDEVFPEEMEDEITGPEDLQEPVPPRTSGVQHIAHISNPNDKAEVKEVVAKLKDSWRESRKKLGLD